MTTPLGVQIGGGTLAGYRLEGAAYTGGALRLLLYWQEVPTANWKTFVHLIGTVKPDGSPLWSQDDHPPQTAGRDVYVLNLDGLPAGEYTLEMGLYQPDNGDRATIIGTDGKTSGDVLILQTVMVNAD